MKLSKFKTVLDYLIMFAYSLALATAVGTVTIFLPYTNTDSLTKTLFIFLIITSIYILIASVINPYISNQLLKNILKYVSLTVSLISTVFYYLFASRTFALLYIVAGILSVVFIAFAVYEIMLVYYLVKGVATQESTSKKTKATYNEEVVQEPTPEIIYTPETFTRKKRILFNSAAIIAAAFFALSIIANVTITYVYFEGIRPSIIFETMDLTVAFIVCIVNIIFNFFGFILNLFKISSSVKKYNKAAIITTIAYNFAFVWLQLATFIFALCLNLMISAFALINIYICALPCIAAGVLYLVGILLKTKKQ